MESHLGAGNPLILTFKVKHLRDFSYELSRAKKVAQFALRTRTLSSKDVKHFGLKSIISNQILRKYSRNKKAKHVRSVVLTVPNQGIHVDRENRTISVSCLKLRFRYQFRNDFKKVNQIEVNSDYVFVNVTIDEPAKREVDGFIGVDRNTTGHMAVVGNPMTGKIYKLGKQAGYVHQKYMNIRRRLQKQHKYGLLKRVKGREQDIIRNLNHRISKKLVDIADRDNVGIKLEDLKYIRHRAKAHKRFRYSLNSWSYYQLEQMIRYKARLRGIPVIHVEPAYTSQTCSRCGHLGKRHLKTFTCPRCGHVDHADSNASFNIASRQIKHGQLTADRDAFKGSTDTPQEAMVGTTPTSEPPRL